VIISKTPLRMSFTGGGSDMSAYYLREQGAVLSTSINKYIYVTVNSKFDNGVRVAYSKNEEVAVVGDIEHPIVRASLNYMGIDGGVEITTVADIPAKGTGLGSSSSFTVGLLNALYAYQGRRCQKSRLAEEGCTIEIDRCGEPIGKQDQYAAAFGGLNLIEFSSDESVRTTPIICSAARIREFNSNLLVFYTGKTRSASDILRQQSQDLGHDQKKLQALKRMVAITYELRSELEHGDLEALGSFLHENWLLKKTLNKSISSSEIDAWYEIACKNGALGGKLMGAGAGGFLMFYAPAELHDKIAASLSPLKKIDIQFEREGSQIIFYKPA
jgi:D-glycero-alpha-D-manno-heptose-7-phosphate kinase